MSVRIDSGELYRLMSSPQGQVYQHMERIGGNVMGRAMILCPVDEGKLKNSIKREIRIENGLPVAYVGTNTDYAIYVHEGTGLYSKTNKRLIVPKKDGGALKWPTKNQSGVGRRRYKGGKTESFTYSKWSRGMKGRPFLTDALKQVLGQA